MKTQKQNIWMRISRYLFLGLLAYMPVHILLSTWLGTSFGILEVTRVAKEGVLIIGAGIALVMAIRSGVAGRLVKDKVIGFIAAFFVLNIVLVLVRETDQDAELLGLAYNVRFLIYLVWAMILAKTFDARQLLGTAVRVVLAAGAFVVLFGLLQFLLLPDDALSHLGYTRANGVLPAFFIDDKPDLERIMSTIRDPNSLGSYLLIILGITSVRALAVEDGRKKLRYMAFSGLTLLAIFWTYSRAAWIGAVATLAVVALFMATRQRFRIKAYKTPLIIGAMILVVAVVGGFYTFKDTYLIQNVVFHADESTVLEDPNELRVRFWQESVDDITNEPLGTGPGTAGLASIRNDQRTVLNENYYFQTAQELGILGIMLLIAILAVVAWRLNLLAEKQDFIAIALLAALAGLVITNFLAHIWANEAVAYTWWGLTGLVIVLLDKSQHKA